ncbi:hypothetical protein HanIR_Chr15g0740041 [Helianthus annuus]|nr:hypothetical protein HanIR_Chr15g0740041 [Helianthus annuus]
MNKEMSKFIQGLPKEWRHLTGTAGLEKMQLSNLFIFFMCKRVESLKIQPLKAVS